MRRRRQGDNEVFGMSFLDVISCGFAAMVAILMLAKRAPDQIPLPETPLPITAAPKPIEDARIKALENQIVAEATRSVQLTEREIELAQRLSQITQQLNSITEQLTVQSSESSEKGTMESPYDGGIPVDATHVVFVIDSSGSMRANWPEVVAKVEKLLKIHPQVTAMQVLSDMGESLIPGYSRKWIPDTPAARKNFNQSLANMSAFSNSSPVEGIEQALRIYAPKADRLGIYVLGDDFTGGNFESVLSSIDRLNTKDGRRIARIHAIGFPWGQGDRFSTLMREVATRNDGVYLGF